MIKIWGRNTSSNVQKAMWAVGELKLEHQRIDIGGPFGKNKEAPYLAMNPNGLVPTLEEEDGFLLWESNSVVRYLAGKHDKSGVLEPKDPKQRAVASQWMDWQLSVVGPAIFPRILGSHPHAGRKARHGSNQDVAGQNHRRDEDPRRAIGQNPICCRAVVFLR
jgi:glutathione S-transferase